MTEQANVEVSPEMEQFISYVEKLSVLELSKLVKALEDRLGVSAAAPVAVAAAAPGAAAPAAAAEEQTEFTVVLADVGASKINVIKDSAASRIPTDCRLSSKASRRWGLKSRSTACLHAAKVNTLTRP